MSDRTEQILTIILATIMGALVVLICAGCASTAAIKTCANGDKWEVRSNRLLWQTENVTVKTPDGTVVEVSRTGSDAEFLGTVVGAAVKTAVK